MNAGHLHIRDLRARAVMAPMRRRLATASGTITRAPLVLVDLETEEGITGISYLFSPNPAALIPTIEMLDNMLSLIEGARVAPRAIEQHLQQRFLLLSGTGIVTMAIAAIDMACWDALGKAAGLPLVTLWGGEAKPIPAYNSTGLGLMGAEATAAEAIELQEFGFSAIKLRLGYPTLAEDLRVARAVREAVGDDVLVMSDYNQCLDVPEAIRRGHALDGEGLYWIEEPVRADDYAGNAAVAQALKTSVQIGENFWSANDVQKAIAARASDLIMPDVMKIGGATAWLRAAALAQASGVPISSHLFPEMSAHLLAVAPTAHYLEYVDWANPVLQEPLAIENGEAIIPDRPGHGMAWNEDAVAKLLL
ncbi:MAG TPA: enolase C-terminal domain-like protein [Xanthobacteraceae bacterium]|nr:enolase C-terminal domain-like protein [Xanthobacteraceae bacterium]